MSGGNWACPLAKEGNFLPLIYRLRGAVTGNWKCIKMCITSATIWSQTSKKIICLLHLYLHTVIQQSWIEEKPSFRKIHILHIFLAFTSCCCQLPGAKEGFLMQRSPPLKCIEDSSKSSSSRREEDRKEGITGKYASKMKEKPLKSKRDFWLAVGPLSPLCGNKPFEVQ